jgi:hypothetical protein
MPEAVRSMVRPSTHRRATSAKLRTSRASPMRRAQASPGTPSTERRRTQRATAPAQFHHHRRPQRR